MLATQPYRQVFGAGVVTLTNGLTVARIAAGQRYVSEAFTLDVPAASPNRLRVKLEVDTLRYRSGEPEQILVAGRGSERSVSLLETAYVGELTDVAPIRSFGDQPIRLTGRAVERASGAALPNTRLKLVINQQGFERSVAVLTDASGAFTHVFEPTVTDSGFYKVSALHPDLTDRPEQKAFTIARVSAGPSPFKLDLRFALTRPDGSPAPTWAALTSRADGTLPVGEQRSIDLAFKPGADVPEGVHELRLQVSGDNLASQSLNVYISLSQSGKGRVLFKAADIYTATPDKTGRLIPGLAGATITLQNEDVPTLSYELATDTLGEALFDAVPTGRYKFRARAANHQETAGRLVVKPGITLNQPVLLDYHLITVESSVHEIPIQDRYDITLNASFETDVPAAVVVTQPASINLPKMAPGE